MNGTRHDTNYIVDAGNPGLTNLLLNQVRKMVNSHELERNSVLEKPK